MSRMGLVDRVRSWFGHRVDPSDGGDPTAKRRSLGPVDAGGRFALTGCGAAASAVAASPAEDEGEADEEAPSGQSLRTTAGPSGDGVGLQIGARARTRLDPLDPPWMTSLEDLPRQIADSVAEATAGARSLQDIGHELEGHREVGLAMLDCLRRLPNIAGNQVALAEETNKILERQSGLLECMVDGVTALRSALRTVEESSRRHLVALEQLETCHRQVLLEYQAMLLKAHRRLGWLAATGVLLAAGALGGVGYVAWRVFVAQ